MARIPRKVLLRRLPRLSTPLVFFLLFLLLPGLLRVFQHLGRSEQPLPPSPKIPAHVISITDGEKVSFGSSLDTALPSSIHYVSNLSQLPSLLKTLPIDEYVLLTAPCLKLDPGALEHLFLYAYFHTDKISVARHTVSMSNHHNVPVEWANVTTLSSLDILPMVGPVRSILDSLVFEVGTGYSTTLKFGLTHLRVVESAIANRVTMGNISCKNAEALTLTNQSGPGVSPSSLMSFTSNHLESDMYPPPEKVLPNVASLHSLSERQIMQDGVVAKRPQNGRVLFAFPWIQMGGSEQSMMHLMRQVRQVYRWDVTVVLVQPYFGEDERGDLVLKHDWIERLYGITHDIIDIPAIAPFHKGSHLLRYILETRRPNAMIFTNARWMYHQLPMVRFLMPKLVIADYNHMVYFSWKGGGCPRFGANHTEYINKHFTASNNVTKWMATWIAERGFDKSKVHTCYIGADMSIILSGEEKRRARELVRSRLNISSDATLVLFAGRFVDEKGLDVLVETVGRFKQKQLAFLIVGQGNLGHLLEGISEPGRVIVHPPVYDRELRSFYAAADILLLPSVNEGIALVLYEAMAAGLLIIATDVGGQNELVTPSRGILIKGGDLEHVASDVETAINGILQNPERYTRMRFVAKRDVRRLFNVRNFRKCVVNNVIAAVSSPQYNKASMPDELLHTVRNALLQEHQHGSWSLRQYTRAVDKVLTVAYVGSSCSQSSNLTNLCSAGQHTIALSQAAEDIHSHIRSTNPTMSFVFGHSNVRMSHLADRYTTFLVANSDEQCSPWKLMRKTTLACSTELILFTDGSYTIPSEVDLQEVVNVMRRQSWDVLGVSMHDEDGKLVQSASVQQILWHDQPRVKTCDILPSTLLGISPPLSPEGGYGTAVAVNVAPFVFMARTSSMKLYFQDYEHGVVPNRMESFVQYWKMGMKVGFMPRVNVRKSGAVQACERDALEKKQELFKVLRDGRQCAEGVKAKTYHPT